MIITFLYDHPGAEEHVDWFDQASKYASSGDYKEALKYFKIGTTVEPKSNLAWLGRGAMLFNLRRFEEAVQVYDIAIRKDNECLTAYSVKGMIYEQLNCPKQAAVWKEKADSIENTWRSDAASETNAGNYKLGMHYCDLLLYHHVEDAQICNLKGICHYMLGNSKEAIAWYDKALQYGDDHVIMTNKGEVLLQLKRYKDALGIFNSALDIKNDYQLAIEGRSKALHALGLVGWSKKPFFVIAVGALSVTIFLIIIGRRRRKSFRFHQARVYKINYGNGVSSRDNETDASQNNQLLSINSDKKENKKTVSNSDVHPKTAFNSVNETGPDSDSKEFDIEIEIQGNQGDKTLDELRELFPILRSASHSLYRYGYLGKALDVFNSLSDRDKKRLIILAVFGGDKDVLNVAEKMMENITPTPSCIAELYEMISARDYDEISKYLAIFKPNTLKHSNTDRIREELHKAIDLLGSLEIEEAYWIFIPENSVNDTSWVKAVGYGDSDISDIIKFYDKIFYDPGIKEKVTLFNIMRKSDWVLHIHNHPTFSNFYSHCKASSNDMAFVIQWKQMRPELADRMKFFVIQNDCAIEYSEDEEFIKRWI